MPKLTPEQAADQVASRPLGADSLLLGLKCYACGKDYEAGQKVTQLRHDMVRARGDDLRCASFPRCGEVVHWDCVTKHLDGRSKVRSR